MRKVTVRPNGTLKVQTINEEPSMTQQQFKDECDINKIMEKYEKTGQLIHINTKTGVYGDFSELGNYQEMLEKVSQAQADFDALPAKVRERFRNDPMELINFVGNDKNHQEAINLGLIKGEKLKNELDDKKIEPKIDQK